MNSDTEAVQKDGKKKTAGDHSLNESKELKLSARELTDLCKSQTGEYVIRVEIGEEEGND